MVRGTKASNNGSRRKPRSKQDGVAPTVEAVRRKWGMEDEKTFGTKARDEGDGRSMSKMSSRKAGSPGRSRKTAAASSGKSKRPRADGHAKIAASRTKTGSKRV